MNRAKSCLSVLIAFSIVASSIATIASPQAAQAWGQCHALFVTTELKDLLPPQFQAGYAELDPFLRERLNDNYERRELVSAENEAARIVSALLLQSDGVRLKFRRLVPRETRVAAITELLESRLRQESARVTLERRLLEIGYGNGSSRTQEWAAFRQRHSTALGMAKNAAMNIASTLILGAPIFMRSTPWRTFSVPREDRHRWKDLENQFSEKIDKQDPELIRSLKKEFAVELTRRILAAVVLAYLTDEFLNHWPKWWAIKANALNFATLGHSGMKSQIDMARIAYVNWKDVVEAFTGTRPNDSSPEAIEMMARIQATSREDLWIHLNHGGPLSETTSEAPNWHPTMTGEAIDQMYPGPSY